MENEKENLINCPWCSSSAQLIWAHGHGQCSNCDINIDECCRRETCSTVSNPNPSNNQSTKEIND